MMNPLKIIEELEGMTERRVRNFLKKLEPESEFWLGASCAFRPFDTWRVKFSLNDPDEYGDGVKEGILVKIIDGMEDGSLNEHHTVIAISKFSQACTEDQWKKWYRPILERTLSLPIGIDIFNEYCPDEFFVKKPWNPTTMVPVSDAASTPKEFIVEPLYNSPLTYWIATPDSVRSYYQDGREFNHFNSEVMLKISEFFKGYMVFEGYLENDVLILRDFTTIEEFLNPDGISPGLDFRIEILAMIDEGLREHRVTSVEVIEAFEGSIDNIDPSLEQINLFLQQGHTGIVVRNMETRFADDCIAVVPEKKSIITCTNVVKGPSDSKYENAAKFLLGRGIMNKQSFQTKVFLGLTLDQKEQYLKDRSDIIGKKFSIMSCGLDKNGNVLFPVFHEWRDSK